MADNSTGKTVRSVCPYCGVGCGIVMQVQDNLIVKVSGDKQHPSNFGRLCTKGSTCNQTVANAGRMEHAFMRQERNRDPARVSIDQAINATARDCATSVLRRSKAAPATNPIISTVRRVGSEAPVACR